MGNKSASSSSSSDFSSPSPIPHSQHIRSSSSSEIRQDDNSQRSVQSNASASSAPNTPSQSHQRPSGSPGSDQNQSNKGYIAMIKDSYQALVNAIIRPPRSQYETNQLGPTKFHFCGKNFQRTDFTLTNIRNLSIQCSMWEPVAEERPSDILPCVIYMHGNSSSRLESLSTLSMVLSIGACLLSFDFCGSGKSDGEYVSLGAFEKDDLQVSDVVRFSLIISIV